MPPEDQNLPYASAAIEGDGSDVAQVNCRINRLGKGHYELVLPEGFSRKAKVAVQPRGTELTFVEIVESSFTRHEVKTYRKLPGVPTLLSDTGIEILVYAEPRDT